MNKNMIDAMREFIDQIKSDPALRKALKEKSHCPKCSQIMTRIMPNEHIITCVHCRHRITIGGEN